MTRTHEGYVALSTWHGGAAAGAGGRAGKAGQSRSQQGQAQVARGALLDAQAAFMDSHGTAAGPLPAACVPADPS